jgi:hypothetical protein
MGSQTNTSNNQPQKRNKSNNVCVITERERKDYILMLCHNRTCKLILDDNTTMIGFCHCKDPNMILIDLEDGGREIINKRYVKRIVLLKERNKN